MVSPIHPHDSLSLASATARRAPSSERFLADDHRDSVNHLSLGTALVGLRVAIPGRNAVTAPMVL
jgi:hypothetical protein